jgi:hypothetical protein
MEMLCRCEDINSMLYKSRMDKAHFLALRAADAESLRQGCRTVIDQAAYRESLRDAAGAIPRGIPEVLPSRWPI